mmetsp:Transcript_4921/g.10911  ORF Transcript_4921/g.10911 Transcript_4921/m.10911 type:complete len:912 (+) Transcript_4921:5124-7859(+)
MYLLVGKVIFSSGAWVVSAGIYLLVGCPKGHALISSIDGISFSQEAQRCSACGSNQYITSTNNSLFSCQPCPAGAVCDGSDLKARVQGSVWVVSNLTGQYVLVRCPPGYELLNTAGGVLSYAVQQCSICPTKFYCPGAASSRLPCPEGSFSPSGSGALRACVAVVLVEVVVALPLSSLDFDSSKQGGFVAALAYTCEVPVDHVTITSISQSRQRAENSITVATEVATKDAASAEAATKNLQEKKFLRELENQGLTGGKIVSSTIKVISTQGTSPWLSAGVGLAVGTLLLLIGIISFVISRRRSQPPEERQLKTAVAELRTRLCITAADGFMLTSERSRSASAVCEHLRQPVIIQRSFVEAAARLSLFQDFDIHQFDAFCICLQCSSGGDENTANSVPPAYYALCDWLLEICRTLIKPALEDLGEAEGKGSITNNKCDLSNEERFPYFLKRVCKARVWTDMGGNLFQRLRQIAQEQMNIISQLCNERYMDLVEGDNGSALLTFHVQPSITAGFVDIRRQDDSKVRSIIINDDSRTEYELDKNLGVLYGISEDIYITQLHRRAKILNSNFQARVFDLVTSHAVAIADTDDASNILVQDSLQYVEPVPEKLEPATVTCKQGQQDADLCHQPAAAPTVQTGCPGDDSDGFGRLPSLDQICTAQYVVTAAFVKADLASLDPPALGTASLCTPGLAQQRQSAGIIGIPEALPGEERDPFLAQALPVRTPSLPQAFVGLPQRAPSASMFTRTRSDSTVPSTGGLTVPEIMCQFRDGVFPVWVSPAQAKTTARMKEKIQEYIADGAEWPRTACILDPVRASVVCQGATQILEVAEWILKGQPAAARSTFTVCRVKNKFALSNSELVGGYRDLMLCCLLEAPSGLKIIGEIQIHDKTLYELKLLMHKLYRIHRAHTPSSI